MNTEIWMVDGIISTHLFIFQINALLHLIVLRGINAVIDRHKMLIHSWYRNISHCIILLLIFCSDLLKYSKKGYNPSLLYYKNNESTSRLCHRTVINNDY